MTPTGLTAELWWRIRRPGQERVRVRLGTMRLFGRLARLQGTLAWAQRERWGL
jgi:hypothetical protein